MNGDVSTQLHSRSIINSSQGCKYDNENFKRFCDANKLLPSMSRRGNCSDNAVAESFFSFLKKERVRKRIYKTRDLARADVFNYIEVLYNQIFATSIWVALVTRHFNVLQIVA